MVFIFFLPARSDIQYLDIRLEIPNPNIPPINRINSSGKNVILKLSWLKIDIPIKNPSNGTPY